jgi:hypothetical protein
MYTQILIWENYTNPIINSDTESNRPSLKETQVYQNLELEDKWIVDEYIDLDKITQKYYYANAEVYKFNNKEKTQQILHIIFPTQAYEDYLKDWNLNFDYYDYLRNTVWNVFFGVDQYISNNLLDSKPMPYSSFEEAYNAVKAEKESIKE